MVVVVVVVLRLLEKGREQILLAGKSLLLAAIPRRGCRRWVVMAPGMKLEPSSWPRTLRRQQLRRRRRSND